LGSKKDGKRQEKRDTRQQELIDVFVKGFVRKI